MVTVKAASRALARSSVAVASIVATLLLCMLQAKAATTAPTTPLPVAATAGGIGEVTVVPAKGTDLVPLSLVTSGKCPSTATNIFATLFGAGLDADGLNVVPNSTVTLFPHTAGGGLYLSSNNTLRNLVNGLPDPPTLKGTYRIRAECRGPAKIADLGDFYGSLTFDGHHAYAATEPSVPAASLVTIPMSEGPPIPTAIGSHAPEAAQSATKSPTAGVTLTGTGPAAKATSENSYGPWLIVVGVVIALGGLLTLLRGRRRTGKAKPEAGA